LLPDNGNGTSSYSTFGSAGGNWGCTVNVFDATLGKPYHISRKVIFNPHFGIRFAWIDQELGVDYGGTAPANAIKFNAENDFWGIGARMGVDTDWVLGYGFKLFSNLSSSILAGWFDTSQTFRLPGIGQPVNLSDDPQMVVPNLELAAGFDWGTTFADCAYYLNIRAGYEFQVWWNQWNSRQFVTGAFDGNFNNVPNRGDLTLNGFTLKVQLDI
jgi:hypothetical protein